MEELTKRIELLRKELHDLEALKEKYDADPLKYLEEQVSIMRYAKDVTAEQIINTVIDYVKNNGTH